MALAAISETILVSLIIIGANVTFAIIGLYEYAYRPRTTRNRAKLFSYARSKLKELISDIKIPIEQSEIDDFKSELEELNTIVRRPDDFLKWRVYLLGLLVLLGVTAVYSLFNPDQTLLDYTLSQWSGFFFVILMIANGAYIYEVWRIDRMIEKLKVGE